MKQKNQLAIKDKNEIMTVKVSEKGQITLPRIIQRFLEIQKGDRLVVYAQNDKLMLKKIDQIVSEMSDDFKDMERHTEESLKLWKDEPDVWASCLKKPTRK